MRTHLLALATGLIGSLLFGVTLVRAQLVAEPPSLSAAVPQHATATHVVTLTNTGSEPLTFCLSFERPLQRVGGRSHLAAGSEEPCGDYGEVLYRFDEDDLGGGWDPYGITMTPEGRLFTAELSGERTFELTPDLQLLRFFEHPHVAELTPFSGTQGVTYDTESGTLWWLNTERTSVNGQIMTRRILLLEGDLDGEPTGRRIEVVPPDEPLEDFYAGGPSYDPATDLFYFLGISGQSNEGANRKLWAMDRAGAVAEGYPVRSEPYPDGLLGLPDVHGGTEGGPEGVRVEYGAYPPFGPGRDRVVVVDRWGHSEGEALETPVPAALFEAGGAGIRGNPLRSRIDPNGVMYMTFVNFDDAGIVGVRPHPLPPSWLVVDSEAGPEAAWDGELAPGESRELVLTFRAGAREVGDYTAVLQAFEAASGEAVEVPLVLTVTEGTDAEDEGAAPAASALSVYPNPSRGEATVALTVAEAGPARLAVYDVLGREVAVLHEGPLAAGAHRFGLDEHGLPSGLYLVRAVVASEAGAAHRLTRKLVLTK